MAWITLSLRKQCLKEEVNEYELEDLRLSREKRSVERNQASQESILDSQCDSETEAIRADYQKVKDEQPMAASFGGQTYYFKTRTDYKKARDAVTKLSKSASDADKQKAVENAVSSRLTKDDYDEKLSASNQTLNDASEEYQENTTAIKDYYDDEKNDLEQIAKDKETIIEQKQEVVETTLQDINQELSSISEQIGTDIKNTAIKFS